MEQIAFVFRGIYIYRSGIVIALAVCAAMLCALALRLRSGEKLSAMAALLGIGGVFSFFLARIVHWYCHYRQYAGFSAALTDWSTGGFSLAGAFFGTLLAALLLRAVRLVRSRRELGALLDALAPAAALGIGIGRFNAVFHSFDRGKVVFETENLHGLPWSTQISDGMGGDAWRAAVFCWEGIAALLIFVVLLILFFRKNHRSFRKPEWADGWVFRCFLVLYGAAEILLDSMRYDSSFLRSNGFVSLVQIIGGVSMLLVLLCDSIRSIRGSGIKLRHIAGWLLWLCGLGLVGYMEYYVQRHGDLYVFCYSLMALGLAAAVTAQICFFRDTQEKRTKAAPEPGGVQ